MCVVRDWEAARDRGVTIDASGVSGTISLMGGVLTIASSVTIFGPSNNGLVVNGNNASQVFAISGAGRGVAINNLEITGGSGGVGGGISAGTNGLFLNNDWIHGNSAYEGGGIGSSAGATIVVANCTISGNTAVIGAAVYGFESSPTVLTTITIENTSA